MVEKITVVKNPTGLHARPAAGLVQLAKKYQSKISISGGLKPCDAKSIFSVLHACLKQGTEIRVTADGADEEQALKDIIEYIDVLEE